MLSSVEPLVVCSVEPLVVSSGEPCNPDLWLRQVPDFRLGQVLDLWLRQAPDQRLGHNRGFIVGPPHPTKPWLLQAVVLPVTSYILILSVLSCSYFVGRL
jgi:hypothetical protein